MSYDYTAEKTVAVLSSEIDAAIALRVLGHLGLALGLHSEKSLLGRATLSDGAGIRHRGISRYPVIILRGKPTQLAGTVAAARETALLVVDFPKEMLTTTHDDELAAALRAQANCEYLGVMLHGASDLVSTLTKKFSVWRP